MIKVFTNRSAGSDLFRVAYPDTGESGDAYDIHVQTGPIMGGWLEVKVLFPCASILPRDTAESGDTYDAEVDNSLRR